ncbi:hypothetical protein MD484_g4873, partial [Candolleomyces efflorescens]
MGIPYWNDLAFPFYDRALLIAALCQVLARNNPCRGLTVPIMIAEVLPLLSLIKHVRSPRSIVAILTKVEGLGLRRRYANYVVANPQLVSAVSTLLATLNRIIFALLFNLVIDRYSQEWVRTRFQEDRYISAFSLSLLLAFKHQSLMWDFSEIVRWKERRRWLWILSLLACITGFALIPTGIVALITPGPYAASASMYGEEIDLEMKGRTCTQWWNDANFSQPGASCDSKPSLENDTGYANRCLRTTANDALSAAVANMLHLSENNNETSSLTMIGRGNVLHFLGPGRGVLPMGPNGSPVSNVSRLIEDPFATQQDVMQSYTYKMTQQGFNANTTCEYETGSPIAFTEGQSSGLDIMEYTGLCDPALGWRDLDRSARIRVPRGSLKTLGSWVCESTSDFVSDKWYRIYLSLRVSQDDPLFSTANSSPGLINIRCTIPPLSFGLYEVTFDSFRNRFEVSRDPITAPPPEDPNSRGTLDELFRTSVIWNTNELIPQMQNSLTNMLVESVVASGVKIFQSPASAHGEDHLRLYAAMLNGIMEYLGTAVRAQLSSADIALPMECRNIVRGIVEYQAIGWSLHSPQAQFLTPMAYISVVALLLWFIATKKAWGQEKCQLNPTDVRSVIMAQPITRTANGRRIRVSSGGPVDWEHRVKFYV